jgi:hypothetical protein
MHQDEHMDTAAEPPFDAQRLMLGCFQPIVSMGGANLRSAIGDFSPCFFYHSAEVGRRAMPFTA